VHDVTFVPRFEDVLSSPGRLVSLLLVLLVSMMPTASWAADDAASAVEPAAVRAETVAPHPFLDKPNVFWTGLLAAGVLGDAVSTRRAFDRYPGLVVEADPLARPFVATGWTGQIAGAVMFVGGDLLVRRALHRGGHHRLERVLPMVLSAMEIGVTAHNMRTLRTLDRLTTRSTGALPPPAFVLP
jgi:hypothetical protein